MACSTSWSRRTSTPITSPGSSRRQPSSRRRRSRSSGSGSHGRKIRATISGRRSSQELSGSSPRVRLAVAAARRLRQRRSGRASRARSSSSVPASRARTRQEILDVLQAQAGCRDRVSLAGRAARAARRAERPRLRARPADGSRGAQGDESSQVEARGLRASPPRRGASSTRWRSVERGRDRARAAVRAAVSPRRGEYEGRGVLPAYYLGQRSRSSRSAKIDTSWLEAAEQLALALGDYTNNTSLALAFEFIDTGEVLLFPGDAQIGSWNTWTDLEWKITEDGTRGP